MRYYFNDTNHVFEKQNLVTLKGGGDNYKCVNCGMVGHRHPLVDYIETKSKAFQECKVIKAIPDYVVVTSSELARFGFVIGSEYATVPAPQGEKAGVWIYSDLRKEPVRCLDGEYRAVERKKAQEKVAVPEASPLKKALNELLDEGEAPQQFLF